MNQSYIDSFLEILQAAKEPDESIKLKFEHWAPPSPHTRSVIQRSSRGVGNPGAGNAAVPTDLAIAQSDGPLPVTHYVELCGTTPFDGYLTLFNLGTSGVCSKLFPSPEHADNSFRLGDTFCIPSDRVLSRSAFSDTEWIELGPTTAETGECERVLAIITRDPINLELEDLHARLRGRATSPRGARLGAPVVTTPKLFTLPRETWAYDIVSAEVVACTTLS